MKKKKKFILDPSKGSFLFVQYPPGKTPQKSYSEAIGQAWKKAGGDKVIFLPFGYKLTELNENFLKSIGLQKIPK